ncbi:hypothetical protein V6N12_012777 [Hibiscus sabdariffa]|uniref:Uncharacterized protein n=1 Tax=Hibiscus sabdariffa TaxID=183260 RepID=A0ABR2EFR8_9ROSI
MEEGSIGLNGGWLFQLGTVAMTVLGDSWKGVVDEEWLTRFDGGWLLGSLGDEGSVEMVLVPAVAVGVVAGNCCRGLQVDL